MKKKKERKSSGPHPRILYYQFADNSAQVNWIYSIGTNPKLYVAEARRAPFEEGVIGFFKKSKGKLLSSTVNIHEFADHLSTAYKKK